MLRTMFKSKIHRATVTQADLHYVGSVTVDADLMDAADLLPGELVHIVDITNGARLETYVIEGERGSGVIGINGAAAHLVHPGDLVILISYAQVDDAEARALRPGRGPRGRRQPDHHPGLRPLGTGPRHHHGPPAARGGEGLNVRLVRTVLTGLGPVRLLRTARLRGGDDRRALAGPGTGRIAIRVPRAAAVQLGAQQRELGELLGRPRPVAVLLHIGAQCGVRLIKTSPVHATNSRRTH